MKHSFVKVFETTQCNQLPFPKKREKAKIFFWSAGGTDVKGVRMTAEVKQRLVYSNFVWMRSLVPGMFAFQSSLGGNNRSQRAPQVIVWADIGVPTTHRMNSTQTTMLERSMALIKRNEKNKTAIERVNNCSAALATHRGGDIGNLCQASTWKIWTYTTITNKNKNSEVRRSTGKKIIVALVLEYRAWSIQNRSGRNALPIAGEAVRIKSIPLLFF